MVGDGPLFPEVAEHVRECGVAEDVRLLGTLEHHRVLDLMRSADVFVQHSLSDPVSGDEEGLPVALLEAMAAGLPVISTRHAGIPEAVLDGVTGNLVDEGDIDAMSDAMQRLATGTAQRALMGAAGWERAAQLFSWPTEKAALLDLFELAV